MKTSVVYIAEKNGKVLGTTRKFNHSDWGLPGGKVEVGESPLQALQRELLEETGLRAVRPVLVYDGIVDGWNVLVYRGAVEGRIHTNENILVDWVNWSDVLNGSFGEFNRKLYNYLY